MKKRKKILYMMSLILILVLLTACGNGGNETNGNDNTSGNNDSPPPATEAPDPTDVVIDDPSGDELTLSGDISLDPALLALDDEDSLLISFYVYEGLVRKLSDGSVVPGIAREWEVAEDGLSMEFSLRSDAVFSDGTQISADLVLENFNRWFDPEHDLHGGDNSVYLAWIENFKDFRNVVDDEGKPLSLFDGIEKVDTLTVLLHVNVPMTEDDFLAILSSPHFSILNPAALGADYGMSADTVVGSGLYIVSDWSADSLTLSPNGSYWGTKPGNDLVFTFE